MCIRDSHYIISHDPRDNADHDLTGEHAQAIGLEYAKANFPGHQALVCTHTDGNNGTGNIHTHIIINSLRKFDIEPQTYTERPVSYTHLDQIEISPSLRCTEFCLSVYPASYAQILVGQNVFP